jgi:diacylglycerol O-acyltransferase / wax synthase
MSELLYEQRMSDQDALMWRIEKDPMLRSTILGVTLLDRAPDRERFTAQIEAATCEVPRLRQHVTSSPFNIAPPEFSVDPYFDLGYHLRWVGTPGDGSLRAVLDMAAPFAMRGFDRARPLWEFVMVEGLQGGKAALVQKLHHSITDGVGAMKLSMAFLDTRREPHKTERQRFEPPGSEAPSNFERLRSGLTHQAGRQLGAIGRLPAGVIATAGDPVGAARRAVNLARSTARLMRPATEPLSPIMTGRSMSLHLDTLSASLPKLKAAAKLGDGRLNDAFVAAVAGGLDRYHLEHGVRADALRMAMPINMRSATGDQVVGNQFVPARFVFPASIPDPIERMRALHELVASQRAEPGLSMAAPVSAVLNRLPMSVSTGVLGSMMKAIDVVTSNVAGAPMPVFIAGARVEANYGFGPLSGAACNVTLLSYVDDVHIAVSTDPAAVPDAEVFLACLQDGFDEIEALA